jgi:glutamine synthetase
MVWVHEHGQADRLGSSSAGFRDILAVPDLRTFRRVPWNGNVPFFLIDFHDEAPKVPPAQAAPAAAVCPRGLLKRVLREADNLGYKAYTGVEFEFYNYSGPATDTHIGTCTQRDRQHSKQTESGHTYIHTRTQTRAHAHAHTHAHTHSPCICIKTDTHRHTHTYICINTRAHMHTHVRIRADIGISLCVYTQRRRSRWRTSTMCSPHR